MFLRLCLLLALFVLATVAEAAPNQNPVYTLAVTEHVNPKTSTSTYTQTLRNRRTGKVVWVRHFPGGGNVTWSKDHRAVVFVIGVSAREWPQHEFDIKLATWVVGGRVQPFFTRPVIHADYLEDFFWSPDKKHLLFRTGNSGDSTENRGALSCLNASSRRVISLEASTRRVQWVGKRLVKYWPIGIADGYGGTSSFVPYEFTKPRLWRLPENF